MSSFALQGQLVRHVCRACNNVCFVPLGPIVPEEGYRCEACENANYERYHFDKSLPQPDGAEPGETPPNEPTEQSDGQGWQPNVVDSIAPPEGSDTELPGSTGPRREYSTESGPMPKETEVERDGNESKSGEA